MESGSCITLYERHRQNRIHYSLVVGVFIVSFTLLLLVRDRPSVKKKFVNIHNFLRYVSFLKVFLGDNISRETRFSRASLTS